MHIGKTSAITGMLPQTARSSPLVPNSQNVLLNKKSDVRCFHKQ
jgi:hypothetical protein